MSQQYYLFLDLGSTSSKICSMNLDGEVIFETQIKNPNLDHHKNRVRFNAEHWYQNLYHQILAAKQHSEHFKLGLCTQRSTFLIWKKSNAQAVTPAISWMDTHLHDELPSISHSSLLKKTGLKWSAHYLAPKFKTLLIEQPELAQGLIQGQLCVGTLDSWFLFRLSKGNLFCMSKSMAARTLLFNCYHMTWCPELRKFFKLENIPLPKLISSTGLAIPISENFELCSMMTDQNASYFNSIHQSIMVQLGTGGFALLPEKICYKNNLQQTLISDKKNKEEWAYELTLNGIGPIIAEQQQIPKRAFLKKGFYASSEKGAIGAPYFLLCPAPRFSFYEQEAAPDIISSALLEGIVFRIMFGLDNVLINKEKTLSLSGGLTKYPIIRDGFAALYPGSVIWDIQESGIHGLKKMNGLMSKNLKKEIKNTDLEKKRWAHQYRNWKTWFESLISELS